VTRLIRAELRKFMTTRLWWGMLIPVVVISAGLSALIAALAGHGPAQGGVPALDDPATVRSVYTAGLSTVYLFTLAIGVIAMAGEFRHQTMTATVLASPRRWRVVVAKLVAMVIVGGGYGLVSALAGVIVAAPIVAARGSSPRLLTDGVPRTLALAVLAVALWAIVGLGMGTLMRNQVVALLVSVGVAWIGEAILQIVLALLHWTAVLKFLPSMATGALVAPATATGTGLDIHYLPWWGGALVLLGYAAVSGGLGAALVLRRDIS
jgi:ABC-2 type transport system permease protein